MVLPYVRWCVPTVTATTGQALLMKDEARRIAANIASLDRAEERIQLASLIVSV